MPLARYAVYRSGPQIWVAPTADDTDGWLASMRHVAIESGAFVVSVPQYIPRSAFPEDFPAELPDYEVFGRGGAAIIEPAEGEVIAGPLYDQEGIVDRRLRPPHRPAREALVRLGRPLQPRGRAAARGRAFPGPRGIGRRPAQDGSSSNSSSPTTTSSPRLEPGPLKRRDNADLAQPTLEVIQSLRVFEVVARDQQLDAAAG